MKSIDYLNILQSIDKNKLNKILKNMREKGFKIKGFMKIENAPLQKMSVALRDWDESPNCFLEQVCQVYSSKEYIKNIEENNLNIESVRAEMNYENKVGLVAYLLLLNPELEIEILELLKLNFEDYSIKNKIENTVSYKDDRHSIKETSITEIVESGRYLCKIECTRNDEFYFIKPLFLMENNSLRKISGENIFGSTGKMKISSPILMKSENIKNYKFIVSTINKIDIDFQPEDEYGDIKSQIYENKIFYRVDTADEGIYEILKLNNNIDINEFKCSKDRVIQNIYPPLSRRIYIENNERLYGPFEWNNKNGDIQISLVGITKYISIFDIEEVENTIYYIPCDYNTEVERKIIYNKNLNMKRPEFDFIDDSSLKDLVSGEISDSRSERNKIKNKIRNLDELNFTKERKERALKIFKSADLMDETIDDIISNLLRNETQLNQVIEKIFKNPNYSKKINEINDKENELNEIKNQIEEKKKELDNTIASIGQVKESKIKEKIKEKTGDIERLENEIEKRESEKERLEKAILELTKNYDLAINVKELEKRADNAQKTYDTFTSAKKDLEGAVDNITSKIKSKISEASFDGMIASKMMKVASEYEKENNKEKQVVTKMDDFKNILKLNNKEELIDYVEGLIVKNANRTNYTRNDIINILLCISQGFLTVFAGAPGTGKTSLCNILAKILGIDRCDEYNRYVEVSVEKGWTSKRDFIGYYNPLTKTFDKNDKKIFAAFETLDYEKKKNIQDFPFVILLDEANLSSMEHYWADFMNVCDLDKVNRRINLCENYNFEVSNTLRFLATINYDHTTEILSPRLIDRAWIILLNSPTDNIEEIDADDYEIKEDLPMIGFEHFQNIFGANKKLNKDNKEDNLSTEIADKLSEINELYREERISISPRIIKMIKKYCIVGKKLFDDDENVYVSLDYAIAQKILPLINGYGDSYKKFLIKLKEKCDKDCMPKCNEIIQNIIRNGDESMQYYQFFGR